MSHRTAHVTTGEEGGRYWILNERPRILLEGKHTGGRLAVFESDVLPGGGPPPHAHTRESEMFYVLGGEFQFVHEKNVFRAGAGTAVFLPRNSNHTFRNVGQRTGRLLVIASPCGMEQMFAEGGIRADEPDAPPPETTPAAIARVLGAAEAHGITINPDWQPSEEIRAPRHDRPLWVLGQHVNIKLASEQTGGAYCLAELTIRPGEGVPPHAHRGEDEVFYVVDGTMMFRVGEEALTATAGTLVYVPRQVTHAFANIGETPARVIDVHTPGGFERFFQEAGSRCTDPSMPPSEPIDLKWAVQVMKKHGMTVPGLVPAGA